MRGFRDEVRAIARGEAPLSPYDRFVGSKLVELGDGRARMTVQVDERMHNPAHILHGGILSGLVDSAMAYAVSTKLDDAESVTNIDLTIRFLKATMKDRLTAEARVVRAGKTIVVVECDVVDSGGEVVARASSSFVRRVGKGGSGWVNPPRPPGLQK